MSNIYVKRSRISDRKFREFLKLFCLDLTATQIAQITRLNRNTVNRFIQLIRLRMLMISETQTRHGWVMRGMLPRMIGFFLRLD